MSNGNGRFMFAGHAVGASARFHRLYDQQNLNHVVPAIGTSVVPMSGGRSNSHADPFRYDVDAPRCCCLLSVDRVDTLAEGRDAKGIIETEVAAEVANLKVVEKLQIDLVKMHMLATRKGSGDPVVTTNGNQIKGLHMGDVEAVVTIDESPLLNSGHAAQFEEFQRSSGRSMRRSGSYSRATIVSNIELIGSDPAITVEGNVIVWKGFGRIILGEIHVKEHERRLTLVRLEMGSDAEGSGEAGDGKSNGETGP